MKRDIFLDAEKNFDNAEKTLKSFWGIISKPLNYIFNKASVFFDSLINKLFNREDEVKEHFRKLPL
ncbi:MAG: hypothetical protein NC935_02220 [Candidatus Omnitrophica bacterium]|nr:hypothetical protein [Candidatus Omnitrophota bacterium]